MKILVFGDPHWTRSAEFSRPTEDGLNEYLQLVVKSFDFVHETLRTVKPVAMIFLGDLWEARDYIDTMAFSVGISAFEKLSHYGRILTTQMYAIVGNHDYWSVDHQIHNLAFLRSLGWSVIQEPRSFELTSLSGLVHCLGVPFRTNYGTLLQEVVDRDKPQLVFSHADIRGARRRAPKGENDVAAYSSDGLNPDIFDHVEMVFNGHYHHPSLVRANVMNVGALTTRTFHDKGSGPRGLIVYDTKSHFVQHFTNPHAREYVDIEITSASDLETVMSEDHSNTYAKILYAMDLEDHVLAIQDSFAGTRLVPIKRTAPEATINSVDMRFSLLDNFETYAKKEYAGNEPLLALGKQLLTQAIDEYNEITNRSPLDFGKLILENFQSIGRIELDLRGKGLYYIKGENEDDSEQESNGSGKSSLIEGLYWILTGKSLRGYKVNEIIGWHATHARGSVEVYAGDRTYTILRTRNDPMYGSGVKLFQGTDPIGARLASDTQTKVDEVLGRSDKNLRHICFMTADMTHRYSALQQDERARLLEEIVDIQPYQDAQALAKTMQFSTRDEVSAALSKVDYCKSTILSLQARIAQGEQDLRRFELDIDSHRDVLTASISSETEKSEALRARVRELEAELPSLDHESATLYKKLKDSEREIHEAGTKLTQCKSEIAVVDSHMRHHNKLVSQSRCPECGEPIQTSKLSAQIQSLQTDHVRLQKELGEAQDVHDQLCKRRERIMVLHSEKDGKRRGISQQITSLMKDLASRSDGLAKLRSQLDSINHEKELKVSKLRQICEDLESSSNKLLEHVSLYEQLNAKLELLTILRNEVFDEQGLRKSMLAQVAIPYLNARIPEYAQYLLGGKYLEVSADDLEIQQSGKRTYTGSSSGERRRVDLIIQFALNDLAIATGRSRVGFLTVDEVLDKLDDPGIYAVKEVLSQKAKDMTVWMVSHVKYAAAIMPRQIVLRKKGGITSLVSVSE